MDIAVAEVFLLYRSGEWGWFSPYVGKLEIQRFLVQIYQLWMYTYFDVDELVLVIWL